MTTQPHTYPIEVKWTIGREGVAGSPASSLPEIAVGPPPQFGGQEDCWTPEHLFVASAGSCFMTTFMTIANFSKLEIRGLDIAAEGKLEQPDGRHYEMTQIILRPFVQVVDEKYRDKALRLLEKAKRACLITASMKSEVRLEPVVAVSLDHPTEVPVAN